MIRKSVFCAAILVAALSTLSINRAYGTAILVFAPFRYVNCIIGSNTPYPFFGGSYVNASWGNAYYEPLYGQFGGSDIIGPGFASWWVETAWWLYNGTEQRYGSIESSAWMGYRIINASGFFAKLYVLRTSDWVNFEWWVNVYQPYLKWQDSLQNAGFPKTRAIDLEVTPFDRSNLGNYFNWTAGYNYKALFIIWGNALNSISRVNAEFGKFKHIIWDIKYDDPRLWYQILLQRNERIFLTPPIGPPGTNVTVHGEGFIPPTITVTFDGIAVPTGPIVWDPLGFTTWFVVPPGASLGTHVVVAKDSYGYIAADLFNEIKFAIPLIGDIDGNGKVDIKDLALAAKQYGMTDPNIDDPPEIAAQTQQAQPNTETKIFMGTTVLALIGAVAPTVYTQLRKKNHKKESLERILIRNIATTAKTTE